MPVGVLVEGFRLLLRGPAAVEILVGEAAGQAVQSDVLAMRQMPNFFIPPLRELRLSWEVEEDAVWISSNNAGSRCSRRLACPEPKCTCSTKSQSSCQGSRMSICPCKHNSGARKSAVPPCTVVTEVVPSVTACWGVKESLYVSFTGR